MFLSLKDFSNAVANLKFTHSTREWQSIEKSLSIVPGDDGGPPEFYFSSAANPGQNLPLSKVAVGTFGRISGIKPPIYREFVRDEKLTASMIHHSLNRPDRGGSIVVVETKDQIVGFYPAEKPHLSPLEMFQCAESASGASFLEMNVTPDGVYEAVIAFGLPEQSIKPGLFLQHAGRPKVGHCVVLHDWSCLTGETKGPARKKKMAMRQAMDDCLEKQYSGSVTDCDVITALVQERVTDPVKFLNRLATLYGFSSQSAEKMTAGAAEALAAGVSHYEVTRYVAGLATREGKPPDRRFQSFAYYVGMNGSSVCRTCSLPN